MELLTRESDWKMTCKHVIKITLQFGDMESKAHDSPQCNPFRLL
jgi:hypothetical protein